MRINQFLAKHTTLSRRAADEAITRGRVEINGALARLGDTVIDSDHVSLDGHTVVTNTETITLILHKPVGYVCSRNGQGAKTIYEIVPSEYQSLNPVGRLDKDSSGLLLMTNDGELAHQLTHPRYGKSKRYEVSLSEPLQPLHQQMIGDYGIQLDDGPSRLGLAPLSDTRKKWEVIMSEGRNRQIRRTFAALGYKVTKLHRTHFGEYTLGTMKTGQHRIIT